MGYNPHVLTPNYQDNTYSKFRYYIEANSMMPTIERGENQP